MGCPIRRSPDQRLLPPTRSLSQVTTSFFAFQRQGIPRMLFVTSPKTFIIQTAAGKGPFEPLLLKRITTVFDNRFYC